MTNTEYLRARLLRGVDTTPVGHLKMPLDALRTSQVCAEFRRLCDNRMAMGAFRYGLLERQKSGVKYDNVNSMIKRLRLYQATGNLEHLVDVSNIAMVEFAVGDHPLRHFEAADDGIHTEVTE